MYPWDTNINYPKNWLTFLRNTKSKLNCSVFSHIAPSKHFKDHGKQVIFANGEGFQSMNKHILEDLHAPCMHEKADSRMNLHARRAMQHVLKTFLLELLSQWLW